MRRVRGRRRRRAIDPASLALVLDLHRAVADGALSPPAFIGVLDAMRIEEEDGVAERALAGAPTLARGGVELFVGGGEERPVYRVENQRLARAVLADDSEHIAHHVERGVLVAVPVDQTDTANPRASLWSLWRPA